MFGSGCVTLPAVLHVVDGSAGGADVHLVTGVREDVHQLLLAGQQQGQTHLGQHPGGPRRPVELHVRSEDADTHTRTPFTMGLNSSLHSYTLLLYILL